MPDASTSESGRSRQADPSQQTGLSSGPSGLTSGVVDVAGGSAGSSAPTGGGGDRAGYAAFELATVLSHYRLGIIEAVKPFPRGSRKAPKLVLKCDKGLFLLKRRAKGKDQPEKVAYCHGIQLHLADRQFPLPHLIGTRRDNNSMLRLHGYLYELFEYIRGDSYDQSLEATGDAGKALALFHKLLLDYESEFTPPGSVSYHDNRSVHMGLQQLAEVLPSMASSGVDPDIVKHLPEVLTEAYQQAVLRTEQEGFDDWPKQVCHSDWHPGNMLFQGPRVVAVIDYDASRPVQRVTDLANGALQFSILAKGDDPSKWPEYLDEARCKRFLRGYDAVPDAVVTKAELRVVPWLMIQALIAEAVIPIALTGKFARIDGVPFLAMVAKKCAWLREHRDRLGGMLE